MRDGCLVGGTRRAFCLRMARLPTERVTMRKPLVRTVAEKSQSRRSNWQAVTLSCRECDARRQLIVHSNNSSPLAVGGNTLSFYS